MATIGLRVAQTVYTNIGALNNTMIRVRSVDGMGRTETHKRISVLFDFYESKAKFLAGENALQVLNFNQRRNVEILIATEMSETSVHQSLKTVLESEGLTITEETL